MEIAIFPHNEFERMATLKDYLILDTEEEEIFDSITEIAALSFGAPISLISLLDGNRQWFKSHFGLDVREKSRDTSFCGHTILQDDIFVVENALLDPRFCDNPEVIGEGNVRFYAGVPLKSLNNFNIGTLCVVDHIPKKITAENIKILQILAFQVMHILEDRKKNRLIIESAPAAKVMIDSERVIKLVNAQAEHLFGYDRSEMINQKMDMLLPERLRSKIPEFIDKFFKKSIIQFFGLESNLYALKKNGKEVAIELGMNSLQTNDGRYILASINDISERKKAEELKNEFISTVSHELRTPLTSIHGSLSLILGGKFGETLPRINELIHIAVANCERLIRLINDILDIEKIESGKMDFHLESINIQDLTRNVVETNQGFASDYSIKLQFEESPSVMVNADPDKISQVITNLISNAIKFSPPNDCVNVSIINKGQSVRVMVKDHGHGISKEFESRIFSKFAQEDSSDTRQTGGTGLGLNICKAIIEKQGGFIDFEKNNPTGTTFYFELPLTKTSIEKKHHKFKKRILVCVKNPNIAKSIQLALEEEDYTVDIAYNLAASLKFLEIHTYAGFTLDTAVFNKNSTKMLTNLRNNITTKQIPIVIISGSRKSKVVDTSNLEMFSDAAWIYNPVNVMSLVQKFDEFTALKNCNLTSLLYVEDDNDLIKVIAHVLEEINVEIDVARTCEEAKLKLHNNKYKIVLLDIALPDGSGFDLIPVIKSADVDTSIIIFSALDNLIENDDNIDGFYLKSETSIEVLQSAIRKIFNNSQSKLSTS